MSTQINFKKGSVEMLLLHVLSCKGDCYGYQLSQLIKKSSENRKSSPAGLLFCMAISIFSDVNTPH